MRKVLKARKGGFTLIELLVVIMIIAVLAGMMMLTMGAATDSAEAAKITNDLRSLKAAGIFLYMDEGQDWSWAVSSKVDDVDISLDSYMDRPMFTAITPQYDLEIEDATVTITGSSTTTKTFIGVTPTNFTTEIKEKLKNNAEKSGLYQIDSGVAIYYVDGAAIYMPLH